MADSFVSFNEMLVDRVRLQYNTEVLVLNVQFGDIN